MGRPFSHAGGLQGRKRDRALGREKPENRYYYKETDEIVVAWLLALFLR